MVICKVIIIIFICDCRSSSGPKHFSKMIYTIFSVKFKMYELVNVISSLNEDLFITMFKVFGTNVFDWLEFKIFVVECRYL